MSEKQKIDFTPLDSLPEKEVSHTGSTAEKLALFFAVAIGIVPVSIFFAFVVVPSTALSTSVGLSTAIPALLLSTILFAIYFVYSKKQSKELSEYLKTVDECMTRFAKNNKFSFSSEILQVPVSDSMREHFESLPTFETNIINGKLESFDIKISDLINYTMPGRSYKLPMQNRVMRVKLPQKMPRIIIDCHVGNAGFNQLSEASDTSLQDSRLKKLTLEGDFSRYFTVMAELEDRIDTLSILTPDVMRQLIDMEAVCDIEFLEDTMFFTWSERKMDAASYKKVFATAQVILVELEQKLKKGQFLLKGRSVAEVTEPSKSLKRGSSSDSAKYLFLGLMCVLAIPLLLYLLNIFFGFSLDVVDNAANYVVRSLLLLPVVLVLGMVVLFIYLGVILPLRRRRINKDFHKNHKKY